MMQPRPIPNNHRATWAIVLRDLKKGCQSPLVEAVENDIYSRDAAGELKYGTRLQPFNGRDSLQDAYEEALDLTVYLKNAHTEGSPVYMLYREALRMAVSIREMMHKRELQRALEKGQV